MRMLGLLVALFLPSLAAADRVTVKGTVLEGTVKSVSGGKVVMSTIYGDGEISIPTVDVTAIETEAPFHVYKADDGTVVGRVVGISPDAVTVADEAGARTEVAFSDVQAVPRDYGEDADFVQRRRTESPWWSGSFDISYATTDGTTDTRAYHTAIGALRERGPNRLEFGASYIHSSTKDNFPEPGDRTTRDITASEIRAWLRPERDLTERFFVFGSAEGEHDGVEELNVRWIGKVGGGYKVVKTESFLFTVDAGPSYVWERFYDGTLNNYVALAFGAGTDWKLPWNEVRWFSRVDYLPSITDWTDDYRLRAETGLIVPIVDPVHVKMSLIDEYNSSPADQTQANNLKTLLGLSVAY